jgi:hypothetical protein
MVRVPGADLPQGEEVLVNMPANDSFHGFYLESGHSAFGQDRLFR